MSTETKDFDVVGNKRLVKQHLLRFSAALGAYVAIQRGEQIEASELLSEVMMKSVGPLGEVASYLRQVNETVLSKAIITHRNSKTDAQLWQIVNNHTARVIAMKELQRKLQVYFTTSTVSRPMITDRLIYRTVWTLVFEDLTDTVTFITMGYIKPVGSVDLGITFVSNEKPNKELDYGVSK